MFFQKPEENLNIENARGYWVCEGFLQKFRYSGRKNINTYISSIYSRNTKNEYIHHAYVSIFNYLSEYLNIVIKKSVIIRVCAYSENIQKVFRVKNFLNIPHPERRTV